MNVITIGRLAKETGMGVETIRFYEREGLIAPTSRRMGSGYREYDVSAIRRLLFIRRGKDLGFSLKEIRELLSLRAKSKTRCASIKSKAEAKIADIEMKISDLEKIKRSLTMLAKTCHAASPTSECPILDYLDQEEAK